MINIKQLVQIFLFAVTPIIVTLLPVNIESLQAIKTVASVFAVVFATTSVLMFVKGQKSNSEKFTGLIIILFTVRLISCAFAILYCSVTYSDLGTPFALSAAALYFYFLIIESVWSVKLSKTIASNKNEV